MVKNSELEKLAQKVNKKLAKKCKKKQTCAKKGTNLQKISKMCKSVAKRAKMPKQ